MPYVHRRTFGAGPSLWLLHSLLADAGSCLQLAERMGTANRVIVPDLPGFGYSTSAGSALDDIADRLADAIGDAPVALFGNGYGSFIALVLALRQPHLVSKLVLAGTGAAFSEPGRAAFRGMAKAAASNGVAAVADVAMRRLFAPAFQDANPALMAERRASFVATDKAMFIGACTSLAELDLRDPLRTLDVPTLIIVGAEDEATPPAMARELADLMPHARLIELDGCAHVPQLQMPGRVAEVMRAFL